MTNRHFPIRSFPKAILHLDGDSFFASCEQALNPALKGRPVVTGKERGIASSMSREAKRAGVIRGMPLHEIRKICSHAIILPSDYESYSIFSMRMFSIVRRFTPHVEEYGIDECFADLTGLRGPLLSSYREILIRIQRKLLTELDIPFSLGLASTKTLAKVASRFAKEEGVTLIPSQDIYRRLRCTPIGKVWGIGVNTENFLRKYGIQTALDFTHLTEFWIKSQLSKPFYEIWLELQGTQVHELTLSPKRKYQSIQKTKTFTPSTNNQIFLLSQLSKNTENACIKLRRHNLETNKITFFLKTHKFQYHGMKIKLTEYTSVPSDIIHVIRRILSKILETNSTYRSTGIILMNIRNKSERQLDFFGSAIRTKKRELIHRQIDKLDGRFGKHTVFLGSSLNALKRPIYSKERNIESTQSTQRFKTGIKRKRIGLPFLGTVN